MRRHVGWSAHLHGDGMRSLRHVDDFVIEQNLDIWIGAQRSRRSFAVLNCSHCTTNGCRVSFVRTAWSNWATSCWAGAVPELQDRRDEADARHVIVQAVVVEPVLAQQIERRRGTRVGLRAAIVVEQANRQSAPAEKPGAKQPDRPATGDRDSAFLIAHARSLANRV
jgi:hypothetical protein